MTIHKPDAEFTARIQSFRDKYATIQIESGNRCGILRFLSERTKLTQSHICRVAKGKRNCVPYTMNLLEKAISKWDK